MVARVAGESSARPAGTPNGGASAEVECERDGASAGFAHVHADHRPRAALDQGGLGRLAQVFGSSSAAGGGPLRGGSG
jgi:hypothetical protein